MAAIYKTLAASFDWDEADNREVFIGFTRKVWVDLDLVEWLQESSLGDPAVPCTLLHFVSGDEMWIQDQAEAIGDMRFDTSYPVDTTTPE